MTLKVEDGSIVSGANSYVTDEQALAIAEDLGVYIGDSAVDREARLKQAVWYIEVKDFKGDRVSADQVLSFPRKNLSLNGFEVAFNKIPAEVLKAQVAVAAAYEAGAVTNTINDGRVIQKEKIGEIETTYFDNGKTGSGDKITLADQFLRNLISGVRGRFVDIVRW